MDIYWIANAGQDVIEFINKSKGRFMSFHCKDMADTPERQTCEVGEGTIDFAEIFKSTDGYSGVEHYIVELEDYKRPAIEGVEVALKNLRKILG